jgi:hypothetical protein
MISLWAAVDEKERLKLLVEIAGTFLTAAGLLFAGDQVRRGVQQYKREQKWKRKDYAAREYDRLVNEPRTGLPLQMLDWDKRSLPLLTDRDGKPVLVAVDRKMLGRALIPHKFKFRPVWGREEAIIRDMFDALLERLGSFEIMIAERLIEQTDLAPYLNYWISLIGDPKKRSRPDVIHILWLYIEEYEFTLVPKLVKRFRYTIKVPPGFIDKLEVQCRNGDWSRKEVLPKAAPTDCEAMTPPEAPPPGKALPEGPGQ